MGETKLGPQRALALGHPLGLVAQTVALGLHVGEPLALDGEHGIECVELHSEPIAIRSMG